MATQSNVPPHVYPPPAHEVGSVLYGTVPRRGIALAGFWRRVAAYLIDGMILSIPSRVLAYLIGNLVLSLIVPFVAVGAYFVICWVRMGATFGYQGMSLRLVRVDERPLDWGTAIVRYVAMMFFQYLPIVGLGVAAAGARADSETVAAVALVICLACCVLGLLNFLWVGWDRYKQAWHDKAARTVVVRLR